MKTIWLLRMESGRVLYLAESWAEAREFAETYTEDKLGRHGTPKTRDEEPFTFYWRERGIPVALVCKPYPVGSPC